MKLSELAKQINDYIAENGNAEAVVEDIFPPFRLIEPEFYAIRLKDGRVIIEI